MFAWVRRNPKKELIQKKLHFAAATHSSSWFYPILLVNTHNIVNLFTKDKLGADGNTIWQEDSATSLKRVDINDKY